MEDIEDLLIGGGAPAAFRLLPVYSSVGVNPKRVKKDSNFLQDSIKSHGTVRIPGTRCCALLMFELVKTFGCSHTQSDSEYMVRKLFRLGFHLTEIKMTEYMAICWMVVSLWGVD